MQVKIIQNARELQEHIEAGTQFSSLIPSVIPVEHSYDYLWSKAATEEFQQLVQERVKFNAHATV